MEETGGEPITTTSLSVEYGVLYLVFVFFVAPADNSKLKMLRILVVFPPRRLSNL